MKAPAGKTLAFRITAALLVWVAALAAQGAPVSETFVTSVHSADDHVAAKVTVTTQVMSTKRADGDHLRIEGFQPFGLPGDPELPSAVVCFLLPADVDWASLRVTLDDQRWANVPGRFDIAPAPPLATSGRGEPIVSWGDKNPGDIDRQGRDIAVYANDADFPNSPLGKMEPSQYRHWKLVRVRLNPVAHNPARQTVKVLMDAVLRVRFNRLGEKAPLPAVARTDEYWSYIADRILNPADRQSFYVRTQQPLDGAKEDPPDYLIITTSYIQTSSTKLAAFVTHKTSLGHTVAVVTEAEGEDDSHYTTGDSTDTRAHNMRAWLEARYLAWGVTNVLLVGDPHPTSFDVAGSVPMRLCYPGGPTSYNCPTDMFFAELSGDWDLDADTYFGEWGADFGVGGIDRDCELAVGRIPFYGSFTELDGILQKIIDYESDSGDISWRANVIAAGAISNFAPEDNNGDGDADDDGDWLSTGYRTFGADWGEAVATLAAASGMNATTLYEKEGCYDDGSAYPLTTCDIPLTNANLMAEPLRLRNVVGTRFPDKRCSPGMDK